MRKEKWKPVVGYEGYYEVSDHGRVKSVERKVESISKHGKTYLLSIAEKILRPGDHTQGYKIVKLSRGGVSTGFAIHTLVLTAFVGPCPEGMECCHGDDIPYNNYLSNLSWGTHRDNILAVDHSDRKKYVYLKEQQIPQILAMKLSGIAIRDIAKAFEVSRMTISRVLGGYHGLIAS